MRIALTAAVVFGLDVVSKWWVQAHMRSGQSIPLWPGVLYITYVRNPGAAFGLLRHATVLFILVAVAAAVGIMTYGQRAAKGRPALQWALGLLLGGSLGNLLDRLLYGRVIDFVNVRFWPFVFNLADSAIVVGGALLLWMLLLPRPAPELSGRTSRSTTDERSSARSPEAPGGEAR